MGIPDANTGATTRSASKNLAPPNPNGYTTSPPTPSPKGKRKAESDKSQPPAKKPRNDPTAEKRLRRFRAKPPGNFGEVYTRALTQRFYVIERRRCGTDEAPEEEVDMAGSTGNIYTVRIAQRPSCSCPHFLKGHQCKHWIYVMSRVLGAKFEHTYQLALLTSELREILANAPPIANPSDPSSEDKNRKPIDGDCSICFCELDAASKETVVWCRAACGQNIHKECFETWAQTKRKSAGGGEVTCPYCRSVWQGDEDMVKNIKKGGRLTREGYVNVADQLGISGHRDTSTYHRWDRWGRGW
ncbi:E3 ubiquitin-protein ligase Zswim2 [Colletotrichum trifolii]|uniref:E3 ubiquitin-protein ligase Zswim2 n=1 Tax=Colletotrichum trifolii TaxID=5466 RepID=A0A4R8QJN9_COLTR|nr:E3 ubiquitin-protein ligase Zswim2 [Colletotrichum trifolii]